MMPESAAIVALSSGGKDSLYMLDRLRRDPSWRVEALVTTVNEANGRVAMHGTPESLLQAQADSLGLPLTLIGLPEDCDNQAYQQRLAEGLQPFRERGIETIACGDLFLEDIRGWREASFRAMGWQPVFPIWHTPTAELARTLAGPGWKVVLTCVDTRVLPESLLGRRLDPALLDTLPPAVDPCGENGEFHTFVRNAPGFARELSVHAGRVVTVHEHFAMVDLHEA